jgi:3-deoxy-D-manno-octulosonic-acid transferase
LRIAYSFGIYIAKFVLNILALFNEKIKSGVKGRRQTFNTLKDKIKPGDQCFWFHCASLGEFEQGLPVFEALRQKYPDYKIVLSFFSPSGYEVRKNAPIADVVVYLPLDTRANAKQFLSIVNPQLTIFVKYEFWPNFLFELKKRNHNLYLISAVFRENQSFFKWYGGLMRKALSAFNHIFTQDEQSKVLLKGIGCNNVTVSGDTRFDRVTKQLRQDNSLDFIEHFLGGATCVVFGSTWPDDDKLYLDYINRNTFDNLKFIIAPHNINSRYVNSILKQLKVKTMCYSKMSPDTDLSGYQVFILDTIGYLSKVYSYADIAYVGGAAGHTGLHNILEPAVFGIPILIGKNYHKFPEAKQLIEYGGVTVIKVPKDFKEQTDALISNKTLRKKQGQINGDFIRKNEGAVVQILNHIRI